MVMVHGIGEHSGRYDHIGRFFGSAGLDVIAFDNRGHGQSGGRRGHIDSFDEFLDDVEDLVIERRQLGVPVVLLGHSLGGLIAATYVVNGRPPPDLLILSAPALGFEPPLWQRLAAPVLSRLAPTLFVKNDIDGDLLTTDRDVGIAYRDDPIRVAGSTARLGFATLEAMASTSSALDRITLPTYVLHGQADEIVRPEHSASMADLPSVTYRRWPGLRHECFNEPSGPKVMAEVETWISAELEALAVGEA